MTREGSIEDIASCLAWASELGGPAEGYLITRTNMGKLQVSCIRGLLEINCTVRLLHSRRTNRCHPRGSSTALRGYRDKPSAVCFDCLSRAALCYQGRLFLSAFCVDQRDAHFRYVMQMAATWPKDTHFDGFKWSCGSGKTPSSCVQYNELKSAASGGVIPEAAPKALP